VKEKSIRWRTGINGIGEAFELNVSLVQLTNTINQFLDAAPKAIQLPYSEGIAFAQHFQRPSKAGRSARLPLILSSMNFCSRLDHGFDLKIKILILSRDTGVTLIAGDC